MKPKQTPHTPRTKRQRLRKTYRPKPKKRKRRYVFKGVGDRPRGIRFLRTDNGFVASAPVQYRWLGYLMLVGGIVATLAMVFTLREDLDTFPLFVTLAIWGSAVVFLGYNTFYRLFGRMHVEVSGMELHFRFGVPGIGTRKKLYLDRVKKVRMVSTGRYRDFYLQEYIAIDTHEEVVEAGSHVSPKHCHYLHYVLVDYMRQWTQARKEGALKLNGGLASWP